MRKVILVLLVCSGGLAHALEPFTVTDIRVEGLQRIAPGTVFNYLPVKVGDRVDDEIARQSIRALFQTGFFQDVELEQEGTVLVVRVQERPSIANIKIVGNDSLDEDELKKGMEQIGFVEGRVFNQSMLDRVVQELKNQFFAAGKYGAEVIGEVTPQERNRVDVSINIKEGETAKIKQINIIGNNTFSDDELRDEFELTTPGIFTFLSKKDRYSKQQLQADLESLTSFYQDQGFLDFRIESTQVTITPDKKDIFVTVNVTEGARYTVKDFSVRGRLIVPEPELIGLVSIVPGASYSRKEVSNSSKAISDRLADEGYAFANVNAIPEVDRANQEVSFTLFVDPGRRVYVRRINITGNSVTRDEVIRRELRQLEGSWFSAQKVQRSRVRLQRLGFFDDVKIDTPAVPGSPDQVDMNISVTERSTGSLLFGVGFSDADGLLLQASVSQRNLFGTGRELDLSFDNSSVTNVIRLQYVNPYHTLNGVSRGFNIFRREVDAAEANTAAYFTDTFGGGVNYRFPLTEFNSLNFGVTFERIDLEATAETPPEILEFIEASPSNDIFKINGNVAHDTRDSILYPSDGVLQRFNWEASFPPSDLEYYKLSYRAAWYRPIGKALVYKIGGELGYGSGYGDTDGLPFFKNFFAGGASTVRGYKARSLGPRDSSDDPDPLGGDRRILLNTELLFPFPGSTAKDKRISLFLDGGQVYGPGQPESLNDVDLAELRFSVGVGINWFSPLGPLSISAAYPINKKEGDETEVVQITLGRLFE